jgi:hypothetical protein
MDNYERYREDSAYRFYSAVDEDVLEDEQLLQDALEVVAARRGLDGWREPDQYLADLLAAAYAAYLVHNGSAIIERR